MNNYSIAAIDAGYITEDYLDIALVRLFTMRMRAGEFDYTGTGLNPYEDLTIVKA